MFFFECKEGPFVPHEEEGVLVKLRDKESLNRFDSIVVMCFGRCGGRLKEKKYE